MKRLIPVCAVVALIVIGFYYSEHRIRYVAYANAEGTYQVYVPEGWFVTAQGPNTYAFPKRSDVSDNIADLYKANDRGLTITPIKPLSQATLDDFYARFFKTMNTDDFSVMSADVKAVRSGELEAVEEGEPAYGYRGRQYVIKSSVRVYLVSVFSKDKDDDARRVLIEKVVSTLKEL